MTGRKNGFTLIEILIVVAIIAILSVMALFMFMNNLGKSRDGKRKADLDRIKTAFEEYYGDEDAYPPNDILSTCGSGNLKPYLPTIPCDPKTKKPYCYIYDTEGNGQNYRILSSLENVSDPIISKLNCSGAGQYCGFETECTPLGYSRFNYGIASSNILVVSDAIGSGTVVPTPTPSPSPPLGPLPSADPGVYACTPATLQNPSACNNYGPGARNDPYFCPITFSDDIQCDAYCPTSPTYAHCLR